MKKYFYACIVATVSFFNATAQNWDLLESNIPVALSFPVVVELNGYIHVMGGGSPTGATDIHLRLNVTSNKWDTLAPVPYKAQQPAGTVLNGKIHYFGGGYPNSGTPLNKHYVYDPANNTWTAAANLLQPRVIQEAVAVDGKIYSMTGQPNKTILEVYDPVADNWTVKNALPDANFWYGAVVAANNEIYRFGGGGYTAPVSTALHYNKVTDTWSTLPSLPKAVHAIAGTGFSHFIFLGGGYYDAYTTNEMWLYDINSQTYTVSKPMPVGRDYHALVTVGNCIYAVGGNNNTDASVATSVLRYCPATNVSVALVKQSETLKITRVDNSWQLTVPATAGAQARVRVLDMTGREVMNKVAATDMQGQLQLNTDDLGEACYLVQVQTATGVYTTRLPVLVK